MSEDALSISLSTLMEVSTLLGHELEDKASVRFHQDMELLATLQEKTSCLLKDDTLGRLFYFGALDFLVYEEEGVKKLCPIELNGTGMAGLINMPDPEIALILQQLQEIPKYITGPFPLVLLSYPGAQSISSSTTSKFMHERILYAEALKKGLEALYGKAVIKPLFHILQEQNFSVSQPTIILGHIKDFAEYMDVENGRVRFLKHPVDICMHDMLCEIIHERYPGKIDYNSFFCINQIFPVTADKGVTYQYANQFLEKQKFNYIKDHIYFKHATSYEELLSTVIQGVKQGKKLVIKPHASGLGRGIEFFVKPEEEAEIIQKIDASINATRRFYGTQESVFPYTICEFIDCCTINDPDFSLHGHKYELRVLVYRQKNKLKAFPTIVKISGKPYIPEQADRLMLLNNVSAASGYADSHYADFTLPLCNTDTLKRIGLSSEHLEDLCRFSAGFVGDVIERFHEKVCQPKTVIPTSR